MEGVGSSSFQQWQQCQALGRRRGTWVVLAVAGAADCETLAACHPTSRLHIILTDLSSVILSRPSRQVCPDTILSTSICHRTCIADAISEHQVVVIPKSSARHCITPPQHVPHLGMIHRQRIRDRLRYPHDLRCIGSQELQPARQGGDCGS